MFKQLPHIGPDIVGLSISGEITSKQTDRISKIIRDRLAETKTVKLLLVLQHYSAFFSSESIYEDLRFAKIYSDHIEKMAVVGDKAWKKTWIALFGLFSGIQAEYFDKTEMETAVRWLRAKQRRRA